MLLCILVQLLCLYQLINVCERRFMNAFMFEKTTVMNVCVCGQKMNICVLSSVKNVCVGVCADL